MLTAKDLHLRDYLKVLKKHRRMIWIFFAVVFTAVTVWTFTSVPQYEGVAKVIIERADTGPLTGQQYRSAANDLEFYQTQFQLIKSHAVARRVVEMLALGKQTDPIPGLEKGKMNAWLRRTLSKIKSVLRLKQAKNAEPWGRSREDQLADAISKKIMVLPVAQTRIVQISFMSPNPEFAALVTNTVAKAYMEETLNMKMKSTQWSLDWMTKKAESERGKLDKAEKALQKYMKANDIVTLENGATVTPEKMSEISTQLVRAETKRKELEALNRQVQKVTRDPDAAETVVAISSDTALQALRGQIVESEKNIMELSGKYGPKHPVMIKALGDLKILKHKRNQEIRRMVQSIKNQYELALSQERDLRASLEQTKDQALRLNEKLVQYNALKREADTNRKLYDALMLKIKEQSITEETKPVNLWIMEAASVPLSPAKPLKSVNLLLGGILGLFGGIGLAFFIDYLDNTVKEPEQAEEVLGTTVLGVVSFSRGKDGPMEEIVLKSPQSVFAENYNALRTALLFSTADGAPGKLLISSASPGEGKTTTSVNLALTLAQSEKRVVLIDGDLRRPTLHKIFKMKNDAGLSSFLAGGQGNDILKKGPLPNLAVITSGPIPPNPAVLLSSARMKLLLDKLSAEYDIVICDSPPVLSVADCKMLCRLFDGALLVTRAHKTTYDMAAKALKALRDVNVRVFGLVINGLDLKKGGYYHYDYFYSYQAPSETPKKALAREG